MDVSCGYIWKIIKNAMHLALAAASISSSIKDKVSVVCTKNAPLYVS